MQSDGSQPVKSIDIHGNEYNVPVDQLAWRPTAYAIVVHEGAILLTKQYGAFHLPGGGVELGEMPSDAVMREVREETGLAITNPRPVYAASNFFSYAELNTGELIHIQSLPLYYVCDFVGGEFSIEGFDEYEKLAGEMPEWIPLDSLDSIRAGGTTDWRSVVAKALESRS